MSDDAINFQSPVGELQWMYISGEGKKNLKGVKVFAAALVLPEAEAILFKEQINTFYEENKPKKTKLKSLGYKAVLDEEKNETGFVSFNFWTGRTFPDGTPKIIKTFNAKGNEVSLGTKKIGNGSRGRIGGAMDVYRTDAKESGVTLYLNSVQLTKFIEFTGSDSFEALEDEDGDSFEAVNDDGMSAVAEVGEEPKATPKL